MIHRALWLVKPETISNTFKKWKFFTENSEIVEGDDELDQENIIIFSELQQEEFRNFVRIDNNLACYGESTDEHIIAEAIQGENSIMEDPSDDEPPNSVADSIPNHKEVIDSINTIRRALMPTNKFMLEIDNIEQYYFELSKLNIQSKITDSAYMYAS
ncbi:uncharacterized protein LOC128856888 [Anastrepha ludens]|uniref:uncharacterized protein LOC128856888 n=1 Tax=Anastrepha ludens TaxID=28586 RepID=UPI0023AF5C86|nr:uncharacterized protein LOC128856888 [Anastrepha ludens]